MASLPKDNTTESSSSTELIVTEQERDIASNALTAFENNNWNNCMQHLTKLESLRPTDQKVIHGKIVAELYKSELTNVDTFITCLKQIANQLHIKLDSPDTLQDPNYCILFYNYAIVLYHKRQHYASLKLMKPLLNYLEPMENLAKRVCLLCVDLYLQTNQADKALQFIEYVEAQMLTNPSQVIGAIEKEMKSSDRVVKELKQLPKPEPKADAFRLKLLQYKTLCYIKLRAYKYCKRELKCIVAAGGSVQDVSSIYLKGHLEYLKGAYRKSMKILNSAPNTTVNFKDTGQNMYVTYYNNIGCIHHYIDKPTLACFYVQKALAYNNEAMTEYKGKAPLHTLGANSFSEVVYNLGISLLHAKRPAFAFDYLLEAVKSYKTNPRLWLRLAECCIQTYKSSEHNNYCLEDCKNKIVQGTVGSSVHRKLIFSSHVLPVYDISSGQSYAIPMPTLEFAYLCLKNALFLLGEDVIQDPKNNIGTSEEPLVMTTCDTFSALPTNPYKYQEVASLRCTVLVDIAYVSLCVRDYLATVKYAQTLLALPKLSGAHKLLGHMYAAEAFMMLDRIPEALEHLNLDFIKDVSVMYPDSDNTKESETAESPEAQKILLGGGWYPHTSDDAKAIFQYNLTVAFALRGDLEKAGERLQLLCAHKRPGTEIPAHIIMLAMYIQLQLGHGDFTKNYIKQHCPQYR